MKIWLRKSLIVIFCLLSAGMPCFALGDTRQDNNTQELIRQQQRERALLEQLGRSLDIRISAMEPAVITDPQTAKNQSCAVINKVQLTGEQASRFAFALRSVTEGKQSIVGQCLDEQGIERVVNAVQESIVKKGYLTTRVFVDAKSLALIKKGLLTLRVVPGRVRRIEFTKESVRHSSAWNALPIRSGDLLRLQDIEQGLENFTRVPTVQADIQINPAADQALGGSDLIMNNQQAFPLRLTLTADDAGSTATGKYQGGVALSFDNLLRLNDLFYAGFNHDLDGASSRNGPRGTQGYTLYYAIPWGYWQVSAASNWYRYQQSVAGAFERLEYSGKSQNSEIKLSRELYRSVRRKDAAFVRGYVQRSDNFINDQALKLQHRRMAGWELGLTHKEWFRAASLDMEASYQKGTAAFGALPAPEEQTGEGISRPHIFFAEANLNIPFAIKEQQLRYHGTGRGQWSRTPLIPQDRFSIGSRYTVRGFDGETSLVGASGWLVRNELGLSLGRSAQEFYTGLDYGKVGGPTDRDEDSAGHRHWNSHLPGHRLAGSVLGLRGGFKGFQYDLFIGTPLKKPKDFQTAHVTMGFNVSYQC